MRVAVLIENQIRSRTEQVGVKTVPFNRSKPPADPDLVPITWKRQPPVSTTHTHTFLLLVNGSTTLKVICYTVCTPQSTVSASK